MSDKTNVFDVDQFQEELINTTLLEVCQALKEKDYDVVNQLAGYLVSGDPGYISNHREARSKISKLDRVKIMEMLIRKYLEKIK